MSLWYESLALCLNDCDENLPEKAKCIIAYLSMPVPRSWWEEAMKTGRVQSTHAQVLHNLRMELSKVANLRDRLSSGVMVALAFMDVDTEGVLEDASARLIANTPLTIISPRPRRFWRNVPTWLGWEGCLMMGRPMVNELVRQITWEIGSR